MSQSPSIVFSAACLVLTPVLSWPAQAHDDYVKPEIAKRWQARLENAPRLAIDASFDEDGVLWVAKVVGKQLQVSPLDAEWQLATPVTVNQTPESISADGEARPQIAVVGPRIYVSWTQALPQPFAGHVRFAVSEDRGATFSEPRTINDDLRPITHRFNAMTVSRLGVTLAWIDDREKASDRSYRGAAIYTAVSSDGGRSFAANRKLADHSCECCRLGIAADRDETPVVFWRHVFGKNVRDFALARVGGEIQRATDDGWEIDACPHHGGALAIDDQGNRHLVWFTGAEKRLGLHYRRIDGELPGPAMAFGNPDRQAGHPMVSAMGTQTWIVWREYDGQKHRVFGLHSANRGQSWSAPRELASGAGAADDPLLRIGRNAQWLIWNTADEGLKVQRLTP